MKKKFLIAGLLISLAAAAIIGGSYDDEALYELILDIFYIQETGEE